MPSDPVMTEQSSSFLEESVLRIITCGSVDDGKSTLMGRLLYDTRALYDDQLSALRHESKDLEGGDVGLDYSLLFDGLEAEREQGITIDVAYRFFSTPKRRFIVADTPGHEQYTRNMATGASTSDLAVILVDASKGVLMQTQRHSRIVSLLGIKRVILAVNKIDLVNYDEAIFRSLHVQFQEFAAGLGFKSVEAIPLSATRGDNVIASSSRTAWYKGRALLDALESCPFESGAGSQQGQMAVQLVTRSNTNDRFLCGMIVDGALKTGQEVKVLPSGVSTRILSLNVGSRAVESASKGQSVSLTLGDHVDVGRGHVICSDERMALVSEHFEVDIVWLVEHKLVPGRAYLLKIHNKEVNATLTRIKCKVDVNTGAHLHSPYLSMNDIGIATLLTDQPIVYEPYSTNRTMGGFILIDKVSYETVAAGMIKFALYRSGNTPWQTFEVTRKSRELLKQQKSQCLWLTGLSGAGKSTIANMLEKALAASGKHTFILDGDNLRHGLNQDLGFSEVDRAENVRRTAEVARLMVDAGLIVIVALISPFRADRDFARSLFKKGEFIEIFIDTSLGECERRDPKGLYAKARRNEIKGFTGLDGAYEAPTAPDIHITTVAGEPERSLVQIMSVLESSAET